MTFRYKFTVAILLKKCLVFYSIRRIRAVSPPRGCVLSQKNPICGLEHRTPNMTHWISSSHSRPEIWECDETYLITQMLVMIL